MDEWVREKMSEKYIVCKDRQKKKKKEPCGGGDLIGGKMVQMRQNERNLGAPEISKGGKKTCLNVTSRERVDRTTTVGGCDWTRRTRKIKCGPKEERNQHTSIDGGSRPLGITRSSVGMQRGGGRTFPPGERKNGTHKNARR